jgi:16S rRNA (guanine527-N7)-methyltransferase
MGVDIRRLLDERAVHAVVSIDDGLALRLVEYYSLLTKWNRTINLTSLSDPAAAVDRLLIEPVSAARFLPAGATLIDLGSGGGSPAIPLALALGSPSLTMVESRIRKAAFLREAARVLDIPAVVEAARFEALAPNPDYRHGADLVSMRAVKPDLVTLEVARALTKHGGTIAIFTSATAASELKHPFSACSTWNISASAMLVTFHVEHN